MPLDKIMPDDINEVACAMLAYIGEQDRQAGQNMSYGDLGKLLQKNHGKHPHGGAYDDCIIHGRANKIVITTLSGNEYELTWNKIAKFIHPYLKSTTVSETVETDTPTDLQDTPTDTAVFDYSAVDDDTAQYLRKATARIANSYADIGAVLAEAQERLSGNNQYDGLFEKWYTSIGMKKMTVYRFIQIHNFRSEMICSSQFGTSTLDLFDNLPKTLQADISSPSAPAEAVNAVLSGDITTHKDYIALKKRIEELEENIEDLEEERDDLEIDVDTLTEKNKQLTEENSAIARERLGAVKKNDELMKELKELRSRPVETVAIEKDPTETAAYIELDEQNTQLTIANDDLHAKIDDLTDEIEELKSALDDAQNVTAPPADDFNTVREFFESSYARAQNAIQEVYDYMKPRKYSAKVNAYARERIDSLKQHIRNLETFYEDDDDYDDEEET